MDHLNKLGPKFTCQLCNNPFDKRDLYGHVAQYHIGPISLESLYNITCGTCSFKSYEQKGNLMIHHIFQTGHRISDIGLEWTWRMTHEVERVRRVIEGGVQLLRSSQSSRSDSFREEGSRRAFKKSSGVFNDPSSIAPSKKVSKAALDETREIQGAEMDLQLRNVTCGDTFKLETADDEYFKGHSSMDETSTAVDLEQDTKMFDREAEKALATHSESYVTPKQAFKCSEENMKLLSNWKKNQKLEEYSSEVESKCSLLPNPEPHFPLTKPIRSSPKRECSNEEETYPKIQRSEKLEKSEKCLLCDREFIRKKNDSYTIMKLLFHFTNIHCDINILRCASCDTAMRSLRKYNDHAKKCAGGRIGLLNSNSREHIRTFLADCFPHRSFEHELHNSALLGNFHDKRDRKGVTKFETRSERATKGECHLCSARRFVTNSEMLRHVIAHSDLRLYKCAHCSSTYKVLRSIRFHGKYSKKCDGSFVTVITNKEVFEIRKLLNNSFPEFDWDTRIRRGTVIDSLKL